MSKQEYHCESCPGLAFMKNQDEPTPLADLGFRVLWTAVSVLILGYCPLDSGNNTIFSAYFMFSLPMLKEYMSYKPQNTFRKIIRGIEIIWHSLISMISFLGLVDVLRLVKVNDTLNIQISPDYVIFSGLNINFSLFFIFCFISIILCMIDWLIYRPNPKKIISSSQKVSV